MIRSKREVDKHVSSAVRNIPNPHERHLKGYSFARMYFEVKDYNQAMQHLSAYISVNESDPRAHHLLGKLYENKDDVTKAIAAYRRSLELNNTQKELVLHVAELYCKIPVDPQRARYWADKAEQFYPRHRIVLRLREHILRESGASVQQIEQFYLEEIDKSPDNVELHVKLTKLYKDSRRMDDAYDLCIRYEKNRMFSDNLEWTICMAEIMQAYLRNKEKTGAKGLVLDIYINLLNTLHQVTSITLRDYDSYTNCANCLMRFDDCLLKAHMYCPVETTDNDTEWTVVLTEMRGQLYYFIGVLITKMAVKGAMDWYDAISQSAVCYLASLQVPLPKTQTAWVAMAVRKTNTQAPLKWYQLACNRLSQVAHLVDNLFESYGEGWLDSTCEKLCSQQGQEQIFYKVFGVSYSSMPSYFKKDKRFYQVDASQLPTDDDLILYDDGVVSENPYSLHHIVWLALQWFHKDDDVQPDVSFLLAPAFDKLHYSVPNMQVWSMDTICQLDIQSFVYAVVYCTKHVMREHYINYRTSDSQLEMLPQCLCKKLVSQEQDDWWSAVCALYTGKASPNERGKLRFQGKKGLEAVRVIGNHGIQVSLLVHLAKCFATRMNEARQTLEEQGYCRDRYLGLQSRAALYWDAAVDILQKLRQNQSVVSRQNPVFKHVDITVQVSQIRDFLEEGKKFLASMTFEKGDTDKAIEMFESIGNADSSYNQAMIYKLLADEADNREGEGFEQYGEERRDENLKKSRDYLHIAKERLGSNRGDPLNKKISTLMNDIETQLDDSEDHIPLRLDFNSTPGTTLHHSTPATLSRPVLESTLPENRIQQSRGPDFDSSPRHQAAEFEELSSSHGKLQEQLTELQGKYDKSQNQIDELTEQLKNVMKQFQDLESKKDTKPLASPQTPTGTTQTPSGQPSLTPEQLLLSPSLQVLREISIDIKDLKRKQAAATPVPIIQSHTYGYAYRPGYLPGHIPHMPPAMPDVPPAGAAAPRMYSPAGIATMQDLVSSAVEREYGAGTPRIPATTVMPSGYPAGGYMVNQGTMPPVVQPPRSGAPPAPAAAPFSFETKGVGDYTFATTQPQQPQQPQVIGPRPDSYFGLSVQSYNSNAASGASPQPAVQQLQPSKISFGPMKPSPEKPTPGGIGFGNYGTSDISFDKLAKDGRSGFSSKGEGNQSKDHDESVDEGNVSNVTDGDDGIHFDPIVKMPDNVDLITGEEDEKVLFQDRAKLYRFDKDSNQWKERGIGNIKLMKHKDTGKIRILMRREQVFKVCANHYITQEMKLEPNATSDRSWVWTAMDFSEEERKLEMLAIKFKTPEQANEFKAKFEECQQMLLAVPEKTISDETTPQKREDDKAKMISLADQFKPKKGTWECQECLVSNPPDKTVCLACNAVKPGCEPPQDAKTSSTPSTTSFTFGTSSSSSPFSFGQSSSTAPKSTGFSFGQSGGTTQSGTGFSFTSTESKPTGFSFGTPPGQTTTTSKESSGFTFGGPSQPQDLSAKPQTSDTASKFVFASPKVSSPSQAQSAASSTLPAQKPSLFPATTESGTAPVGFTFGNTAGSASALLGAFAAKQQVDADKGSPASVTTAQTAVPPATTSAANAILFSDSAFKDFSVTSDGTTTSIKAVQETYRAAEEEIYDDEEYYDENGEYYNSEEYYIYSEDEVEEGEIEEDEDEDDSSSPRYQSPLHKFGTVDSTPSEDAKPKSEPTAADDVAFVSEMKPTDEQIRKARALQLPDGFYLYELKPPCPGCPGCEDDDLSSENETDKSLRKFMGEPPRLVKRSELSPMTDGGRTVVIVTSPGKAASAAAGLNKPSDVAEKSKEPASSEEGGGNALFGGTLSGAGLSFASVASATSDSFKGDSSFKGFQGAGAKLFQGPQELDESGNDKVHDDNAGDHIHFEPIVSLPEKVDLKTGEENEEVLYSERSRLYRFDKSTKQWKERGIGPFKLLKNRETGFIRALMRREQVLKVCCNHLITADMELKPNAGSDRSWVWNAMDYADEEPKYEQLALKLKTPEIADAFKNKFLECQEMLRQSPPTIPETETRLSESDSGEALKSPLLMSLLVRKDSQMDDKQPVKTLTELFKPPPGSWVCNVCEVRNEASKMACCACGTMNEGATKESTESTTPKGFSFGTPSDGRFGAFTFGYQPQKEDVPAENKPFSGFTFPTTEQTGTTAENVPESKDSPSGGLLSKKAENERSGANKQGLNVSSTSQEDGDTYYKSDDGHHIHFEPIVSMPTDVELKTGEEDEDVIFCYRSKLYRFDPSISQWKERGVGDIKILQHRENGRGRIIMRREQVLKLCANHYITDDMTLKPMAKSDRSWVWTALDASDGTPQTEQLAIKFKTPDIAVDFQKKFEQVKESQRNYTPRTATTTVQSPKVASVESTPKFSPKLSLSLTSTPKTIQTPTKSPGQAKQETPKSGGVLSPPKFSFKPGFPEPESVSKSPEVDVSSTPPSDKSKTSVFSGFSFGYKPSQSTFSFGQPSAEGTDSQKVELKFGHQQQSEFVQIVFEKEPSVDQIKDAKKLQLPKTFYLYEDKPPCPGCKGCDDEFPEGWDNWGDRLTRTVTVEEREEQTQPDSTTEGATADLSFGTKAVSSFSFANIASTSDGSYGFGSKDPKFHFEGAGNQLFGSPLSRSRDDSVGDDHVVPSEDIHFEPIVSLPKVEVKTGEEDEEILYSQRARLYRFDQATSQWKERGIGPMKLLKHKASGRIRVLMRREQVLKVCANHVLTQEMQLRLNAGSDRSWVWNAMDFAGEEPQNEQLAIKFKTPELAMQFKEKFEECQRMMAENVKDEDDVVKEKPSSSTDGVNTMSLADMFRKKPGTWECDACLVSNRADITQCVACGAVKPGAEPPKQPVSSTTPSSAFSFGVPAVPEASSASTAFTFGASSTGTMFGGTPSKSEGFTFGSDSTKPSVPAGFNFGQKSEATNFSFTPTSTTSSSSSKPFGFGLTPKFSIGSGDSLQKDLEGDDSPKDHRSVVSSSGDVHGEIFSHPSTQSSSKPATKLNIPSFADLASSSCGAGFSFAVDQEKALSPKKVQSPQKVVSPVRREDSHDDSYYKSEDEGDSIYVEPIAVLPDNVELVTGEEDENVLYSHRARLYRYDPELKQWKERGIGDLKILEHKESGRMRILMRREQVFKVCANHYLTPDMTLSPNIGSDRSWVWNAMDYSEEEAHNEQLAVKFKTAELAQEFKQKFEEFQKKLPKTPKSGKKVAEVSSSSSKETLKDLGELFKKKHDMWECQTCLISNPTSKTVCEACSAERPMAVSSTSDTPTKESKDDSITSETDITSAVTSSTPVRTYAGVVKSCDKKMSEALEEALAGEKSPSSDADQEER
ncbi:E3 SUMO-protein ligase RanBP2-like [Glandiceps talaboti]